MRNLGATWLIDEVDSMTDTITHVSPSAYNEATRYLPKSVSSIPGPLRYAVNPFMREIVDCFDIDSDVREVSLMKGVQITYSTVLESGAMYYMGHVKTMPMMYMTADKELAEARIENNFIPMLNHSGLADIVRSSDEGNSRKTGKTKSHLQFEGGGYLVPFGAKNADKMRSYSICVMMKDEIDAWPITVGKDGDPDKLSDGRCRGYWERRKVFRGSTPTIRGVSKIAKAYKAGDQRKYYVKCKSCRHPQALRWSTLDKSTGVVGGMTWDIDEHGILDPDTVRYCCSACGFAHYEYDKAALFAEKNGAKWVPTARPKARGVRSYHLPALYSPIGMAPWHSLVTDYLEAYDPVTKKVKDSGKFQVFYNNVLAEPYEIKGAKILLRSVEAHRVQDYKFGEIPNRYAEKHSGGKILFLTCQVDVHKSNLAVAVMGWTRDLRCYVIDYWRFEVEKDDDDATELSSPVWARLRDVIEHAEYMADDGHKYRVLLTLVDAGFANATVCDFCGEYASNVYPILGRDRPGKNQVIKEFSEFNTQAGTTGYKIVVDHYKDRIAPVLRREWHPESGEQDRYHFNAPSDMTKAQITELTKETRMEVVDGNGNTSYVWKRQGGAANELFDLLGYGHAAVEIFAWLTCIQTFGMNTVEWPEFWEYAHSEEHGATFGRTAPRSVDGA